MALGLAIAIPYYIAFNYLVGRKNDLAVDIDKISSEILNIITVEMPPSKLRPDWPRHERPARRQPSRLTDELSRGSIRHYHGRLDFAPFVGVLFLMLPLLLFHTSLQRGFQAGHRGGHRLCPSPPFRRPSFSDPSLVRSCGCEPASSIFATGIHPACLNASRCTVKKTDAGELSTCRPA